MVRKTYIMPDCHGDLSVCNSNKHTFTLWTCQLAATVHLLTWQQIDPYGCNLLMLTCQMNICTCPAFHKAHGIIHCTVNDLKCQFMFPSVPHNGSPSDYVLVYLILQKWHVWCFLRTATQGTTGPTLWACVKYVACMDIMNFILKVR